MNRNEKRVLLALKNDRHAYISGRRLMLSKLVWDNAYFPGQFRVWYPDSSISKKTYTLLKSMNYIIPKYEKGFWGMRIKGDVLNPDLDIPL